MVLDAGRVVEFDTPASLIERGGFFAGLVAAQHAARKPDHPPAAPSAGTQPE